MTKSKISGGRKKGVGKDNVSTSSKAGGTSLAGSSALGSLDEQLGLFQLALESFPHPFCIIDAGSYRVKLANSASGITKLNGSKKCFAITHRRRRPCGESGIPCPIDIIKETKKPTVVEHLHGNRHGEQRYYEVHGYPVFDGDGSVASIMEFSFDVTERRLAEEALKQSEERWRSLVANAPDTIFLVDREAKILFVNRCPNGHKLEDLVGRTIFECIPVRHRQKVVRTIERVFRTGKPDRYEIASEDEQNGTIWYAGRLAPITDGKKVTAVILMTRDVTERKRSEKELMEARAELEKRVEERTKELKSINEKLSREARVRRTTEQALKDSEELHRVILNQISDTLLITDDQGNFTYVSPRAGDLFGHSREQILAMGSIYRLLGPNLFDREDIMDGKELLNIKRTVVDRAGRPHTLLVNIKQVAIGGGTTLYTCRDITRLSQAEQALKAVNEELEVERQTLREKNTALKEILGQIEEEKKRMASQMHLNVNRMALPILKALEQKTYPEGEYFVALLRNCLSDITSPFIGNLESDFSSLTPRELEICQMIKSGFTSKQIAEALTTSVDTVLKQRKMIRRKLGISNQKINLVTHLKSLEHSSLERP